MAEDRPSLTTPFHPFPPIQTHCNPNPNPNIELERGKKKKRDRKILVGVMDEQGKPERKREGDDVVGERTEEKRRKREDDDDDDVGEREEREGPSQVLPPSCHSVFCCYDDSDTEEEEEENGSDNKLEGPSHVMPPSSLFVFDDDLDPGSCSSDDCLSNPDYYIRGFDWHRPLDAEASNNYNQQIMERTRIVPLTDIKESPSQYEAAVNHAKLAINKYNIEHDEVYEFVDLERVNSEVVSGCIYYITFQVKNLKAAGNGNGSVDGDGDNTPLETFQAKVWRGIKKTKVQLCRPEPIKPQN